MLLISCKLYVNMSVIFGVIYTFLSAHNYLEGKIIHLRFTRKNNIFGLFECCPCQSMKDLKIFFFFQPYVPRFCLIDLTLTVLLVLFCFISQNDRHIFCLLLCSTKIFTSLFLQIYSLSFIICFFDTLRDSLFIFPP